ncbi:HAMP domain-containing histidine kinase [Alishewanella sp. BS5-314]|uniref:sensor histidine kinase n=1 Tax=Alishewanella sp. BS5-314 TaxID=2755587 RepID=UPI0021BB534B|nr:HAMP domain-containing sensor histidine kinase [Alishewanella sp. BS5-314]MCT8124556.1 HAMP domain-containing histidine kinase [Alishewanella sp. BS5-314]
MRLKNKVLSYHISHLVVIFMLITSSLSSAMPEPSRVLILNSHSVGMPWSDAVMQELLNAFASQQLGVVQVDYEYTGLSSYSDALYAQHLAELYKKKYQTKQPDVVITLQGHATRFLVSYAPQIFSKSFIHIYTGDEGDTSLVNTQSKVIALITSMQIKRNIELVLKLKPATSKIYAFVDNSPVGNDKLEHIKQELKTYPAITLVNLSDIPIQEAISKVATLPTDSVIFYTPTLLDVTGQRFIPRNILNIISQQASVPIFTFWSSFLGAGAVGGYLADTKHLASDLLNLTFEALASSDSTKSIIYREGGSGYYFDHRQLHKWGISDKNLPQNSVVKFAELTFWQLYKQYLFLLILGVSSLLLTLLLFGYRNKQLRLAKIELQKLNESLEHKVLHRTIRLQESQLKTEQALEENRQLLTMLSHELRSPMSVINSSVAVLEKALEIKNPQLALDMTLKIRQAVTRFRNFMDSLAAADRLQTKIRPEAHSCDILVLANNVIYNLSSQYPNRVINLTLLGESQTTVNDPLLLEILMQNLLDNALKYSPNSACVEFNLVVTLQDISFNIADRGPGFLPAEIDQMFKKYTRGSAATKVSGTGIGLYLVKKILDLFSGNITIENRTGGGACVSVRLPVIIETSSKCH